MGRKAVKTIRKRPSKATAAARKARIRGVKVPKKAAKKSGPAGALKRRGKVDKKAIKTITGYRKNKRR